MTRMTNERVAKALGYRRTVYFGKAQWTSPSRHRVDLPDFIHSLDAIAGAIEGLSLFWQIFREEAGSFEAETPRAAIDAAIRAEKGRRRADA